MNSYQQYYQSVLIDGNPMPLGKLLSYSAEKFADLIALTTQEQSLSYKELYEKSLILTHYLADHGIKKGDTVIICFENSIEFYVAYFGVVQTGAIVIPVSTFFHGHEMNHVLNDASPAGIITSDKFISLFDEYARANTIFFLADLNGLSSGERSDYTPVYPGPDEVTVILYTSGTTGLPKGVMLSARNIMVNTVQGLACINLTKQERVLAILPLFHSFAQNTCVWAALLVGGTVIIVPKIDRRSIKQGLAQGPTIFLGIPALYGILILMKNTSLETVRYFICGGDALPDKIRALFALIYQRKLCNGYGLTESSPLIAINLDDETVSADTVGKPAPGISCSIRNSEGHEVAPGVIGQLWVKGDNVMLGYYKAPDITNQVIVDGWLDTGDLAAFDTKGRLRICGRVKDLIVNKGLKIYPQEVENVLLLHEDILQAAVIGYEREDVGQIPVAFIYTKNTKPASLEKELYAWCARFIALYKIPRRFIVLTISLPVTSTGKIDKKKLKSEYKIMDI